MAVATRTHSAKPISDGVYYGGSSQLEELVLDFARLDDLDAKVTRNHYGCLVLNAARAMFIDVDMPEPAPTCGGRGPTAERLSSDWERTLDDIRTVLSSRDDEGFRIYRTSAGFRILATAHPFEPDSHPCRSIMDTVGADPEFIRLCRVQTCFRARLTPKPWRCGCSAPPNLFPRHSIVEQQRFAEWKAGYERASVGWSTCKYLDTVGLANWHTQIAPLIEFHDRETKALEELELA
jgi:hypothetical protein